MEHLLDSAYTLTSDLLHPSAYQIILWMVNIHRYLQSLDAIHTRWKNIARFFFLLRIRRFCLWILVAFNSRIFIGQKWLIEPNANDARVCAAKNIHGMTMCVYLNSHWHGRCIVGPIIRLLVLMCTNRWYEFSNCVDFTHTAALI